MNRDRNPLDGSSPQPPAVQDYLQGTLPQEDRRGFWWELGGLLVLLLGIGGYWIYQELERGPILLTTQPTPSLAPSLAPSLVPSGLPSQPTALATPGSPGLSPSPGNQPNRSVGTPLRPDKNATPIPALDPNQEIYQRSPETGTYFPENPSLGDARREIASQNGRICLKLVNPTANPSDAPQVVVSSISLRGDGLYVDATGEKLNFDRSYTVMRDRIGSWQRLQSSADRDGAMGECLASQQPYVK